MRITTLDDSVSQNGDAAAAARVCGPPILPRHDHPGVAADLPGFERLADEVLPHSPGALDWTRSGGKSWCSCHQRYEEDPIREERLGVSLINALLKAPVNPQAGCTLMLKSLSSDTRVTGKLCFRSLAFMLRGNGRGPSSIARFLGLFLSREDKDLSRIALVLPYLGPRQDDPFVGLRKASPCPPRNFLKSSQAVRPLEDRPTLVIPSLPPTLGLIRPLDPDVERLYGRIPLFPDLEYCFIPRFVGQAPATGPAGPRLTRVLALRRNGA